METEQVILGAGCFWGVEFVFRRVPGVLRAEVGYAGGTTSNPTYAEVCSHTTGHAEVCRVTFNPELITFDQLLEVFWAMHDPTQVDRQGPDIGDQYRSCIFTTTEKQMQTAIAVTRARARKIRPPDRHSDRGRTDVLHGGGVPPGLLREERTHPLLPRRPDGRHTKPGADHHGRRGDGSARLEGSPLAETDLLMGSVAEGLVRRLATSTERDPVACLVRLAVL